LDRPSDILFRLFPKVVFSFLFLLTRFGGSLPIAVWVIHTRDFFVFWRTYLQGYELSLSSPFQFFDSRQPSSLSSRFSLASSSCTLSLFSPLLSYKLFTPRDHTILCFPPSDARPPCILIPLITLRSLLTFHHRPIFPLSHFFCFFSVLFPGSLFSSPPFFLF